ncbi:uncharacterized protein [Epargyreus clarus]|uniref:uncharacterized protein n=1 Tax=Epargyreus clarus TaxID=520877 RepID=UPI003C2EEED7
MRRYLLPVLLLTTVALSTSDILPILAIKQVEPELDSSEDQVNENTLDNRHNNGLSNDILYKVSIGSTHDARTPLLIPQKSNVVYLRENSQVEDVDNDRINKKDKYDDEGFRKEQWHNYPRQLDRLQKYLYRHHQFDTVLNPEPDEPDDISKNIYEIATNEMNRPSNKNGHDILDTVVAASPLLILKIRLAYLKNDLQSTDLNEDIDTVPIELIPNSIVDEKDEEVIDPIISAIKVKREGISNTKGTGFSDKATNSKKTVKKRIFSLWSRLQSLSHKGHELQHRRHLHAFYGFPDDGSGGGSALTAETRASFIRPPGSPLRDTRAILYGFWLSSCTWRVRTALRIKNVDFEERTVDIVKARDQKTQTYRAINPAQKVPALMIDGETIVESMAILQYLEDTRPEPALVPKSPILRARMREICETVVSGIQPLQNLGLKPHFETETQYTNFTKYWTNRGLQTLEDLLEKTAGKFCVGDEISQADLCLVPQLFNAVTRHGLDLEKYPTVSRLYKELLNEKAFSETHPKVIKMRNKM